MCERTCAIPDGIVDSTVDDVPDILNPQSEGVKGLLDPLIDSIADGQDETEDRSSTEGDETTPVDSGRKAKSAAGSSTPGNLSSKACPKGKKSKKGQFLLRFNFSFLVVSWYVQPAISDHSTSGNLPEGLEKAIQDTSDYRVKCLASKERREAKRMRLEKRRIRIEESDAQVRRIQAEAEQTKLRISCLKDLKEAGFGDDNISNFLQKQFPPAPRAQSETDSSEDGESES
jgi:hypothetical protein